MSGSEWSILRIQDRNIPQMGHESITGHNTLIHWHNLALPIWHVSRWWKEAGENPHGH